MRPRITLARFLLRLSSFMQKSSIMVMRPDDLVEFSRQTYERQNNLACWSSPDLVDQGLTAGENKLLSYLPSCQGKLLLLGVGGGREAIPLAKCGFTVTGVDYIPEMIDNAKQNVAKHGLTINGLVQEISRLELDSSTYDVVWLSAAMYSSVPTRQRRIRMLQRIYRALKPGGYLACQFHWNTSRMPSPRVEKAGKVLAWLTLGNLSYERGDMLWHNIEFIHGFLSKEELTGEFNETGFELVCLEIEDRIMRGGAILKKPESSSDDL